MSVTTGQVVLAVTFFVLGWVAHVGFDEIVDLVADGAGGLLWDVFALVGVLAVCLGVGYVVTH